MSSNVYRFLVLAAVLLTAVTAEDYRIGSCQGSLLSEQAASNATGPDEHYLVAFSGSPGDRISCVVVEDQSETKRALTSLLRGGPGQRYAILSVNTPDREDANFVIRIYGTRQSYNHIRRKREATVLRPTIKNVKNAVILLRMVADTLERLLTLLEFLDSAFGDSSTMQRAILRIVTKRLSSLGLFGWT